ncbi:MAG TPA: hypothetical protein VIU61_24235 [Kofleriaceae bacterium]
MFKLVTILLALLAIAVFFLLLFVVVRAAIKSALKDSQRGMGHLAQILAAQTELTGRLAKHLIAQTDLMLLSAKHDGVTDTALEPVLAQVAERKAEPAPPSFFGMPLK